MNKQIKWLAGLAAVAVCMIVLVFIYDNLKLSQQEIVPEPTKDAEQESVVAPDFTVYNKEGNAVSLSDFSGKPVVINFWASWCGPCREELPDFEAVYKEFGDKVVFMMVNLTDGKNETQVVAQNFVDSGGYTFPLYFDLDLDAAITYGLNSIPASLFVDSEGNVLFGKIGIMKEEQIRKYVQQLS